MSTSSDGAPPWLFSFVDLAFLLLLALTQLGGDDPTRAVDLGEIAVPRLHAGETNTLAAFAPERWQLRVHPQLADERPPFELVAPDAEPEARLAREALFTRLSALRDDDAERPLLAPHEDSRSQDLLEAVAAIDELWARGRRATVAWETPPR